MRTRSPSFIIFQNRGEKKIAQGKKTYFSAEGKVCSKHAFEEREAEGEGGGKRYSLLTISS